MSNSKYYWNNSYTYIPNIPIIKSVTRDNNNIINNIKYVRWYITPSSDLMKRGKYQNIILCCKIIFNVFINYAKTIL